MTASIATATDPLTEEMSENETPDAAAAAPQEPDQLQYSIMRRGEETALGPFTIDEVFARLRDGEIANQDFVYYEGMADWAPIEEVFEVQEQISHFVDDGQDRDRVADSFQAVTPLLATGEDIYYIAVQEKTGLLSKQKVTLVMTNKRLFILHHKRSGFELESHRWDSVTNTLMKDEGNGLATFSVLLNRETRLDIPHLPVAQVRRLFQLSQELGEIAGE